MSIELYFPKSGSKRKISIALGKILNNIHEIEKALKDVDQLEFAKNRILHNSVFLDMATIGELLKTITGNPDDENIANPDPYNLMQSFPDVDWQDLKGFRDINDHNYFIINPNMVWRTLTFRLQKLQSAIFKIREIYPDISKSIDIVIDNIAENYNRAVQEAIIDTNTAIVECQILEEDQEDDDSATLTP